MEGLAKGHLLAVGHAMPWYDNIKQVHVAFDAVHLETDMYNDSDAIRPARLICSAILGSAPFVRHGSVYVKAEVVAINGETITECKPAFAN